MSCPIRNEECIANECSWWEEVEGCCAAMAIAYSVSPLWGIANLLKNGMHQPEVVVLSKGENTLAVDIGGVPQAEKEELLKKLKTVKTIDDAKRSLRGVYGAVEVRVVS